MDAFRWELGGWMEIRLEAFFITYLLANFQLFYAWGTPSKNSFENISLKK